MRSEKAFIFVSTAAGISLLSNAVTNFLPRLPADCRMLPGNPSQPMAPMVAHTAPTGTTPVVIWKWIMYSAMGGSSPPPEATTEAPYFPSKPRQ